MRTPRRNRRNRPLTRADPHASAAIDADRETARVDAELSALAGRLADAEDELRATGDRLARVVAWLRRRLAGGADHA
jgi:hypothetical protein